MQDGVDEDEGVQEARVQQGQLGRVAVSHAVADADDGVRHCVLEGVDQEEEVAAVVPTADWAGKTGFCQL